MAKTATNKNKPKEMPKITLHIESYVKKSGAIGQRKKYKKIEDIKQ